MWATSKIQRKSMTDRHFHHNSHVEHLSITRQGMPESTRTRDTHNPHALAAMRATPHGEK